MYWRISWSISCRLLSMHNFLNKNSVSWISGSARLVISILMLSAHSRLTIVLIISPLLSHSSRASTSKISFLSTASTTKISINTGRVGLRFWPPLLQCANANSSFSGKYPSCEQSCAAREPMTLTGPPEVAVEVCHACFVGYFLRISSKVLNDVGTGSHQRGFRCCIWSILQEDGLSSASYDDFSLAMAIIQTKSTYESGSIAGMSSQTDAIQ